MIEHVEYRAETEAADLKLYRTERRAGERRRGDRRRVVQEGPWSSPPTPTVDPYQGKSPDSPNGRRRGAFPQPFEEHRLPAQFPQSPNTTVPPCHRIARRFTEQHYLQAFRVVIDSSLSFRPGMTMYEFITAMAYAMGLWHYPDMDDVDFALPERVWDYSQIY